MAQNHKRERILSDGKKHKKDRILMTQKHIRKNTDGAKTQEGKMTDDAKHTRGEEY